MYQCLLLAAEVHAGILCAEFTMNSMPLTSSWPTSLIKVMPGGRSYIQDIIYPVPLARRTGGM